MEGEEPDKEELVEVSHGQRVPSTPTPTPTPYFKEQGTAAAVAYETLISEKRSDEQKANLISFLLYTQQQQIYKLEQQAQMDSIEIRGQATLITELKENAARREGAIELLNERAENTERRLSEIHGREKVAILLAGLLISLGIGTLSESGAIAAGLIIIGGICAAAGISPKVMGLIFKDKNK